MNENVLLVDMDGVLADFDGPLFRLFADRLDINSPEEQRHRFLTDHLPTAADRKAMRSVVESPGWFRALPVMPLAKGAMDELERQGWDIWLCSKPLEASPTCMSEKHAWVAEHFPQFSKKLILAPNKGMVNGAFLIDDAIKREWLNYATWTPVTFAHPWNDGASYGFRGDWPEICRYLNDKKENR